MSSAQLSGHRCHTCRRRRIVCDRSLPRCKKCEKAGVECLGYGKLVLWNQGVASRGRMMGKTYSNACTSDKAGIVSLRPPPVDAIYQDLSPKTRFYLRHFANHVCLDIVQRDVPGRDSARSLIRLARDQPVLLHMAVATAAHHLFNVSSSSEVLKAGIEWPACSIDRANMFAQLRQNTFLEDAVAAEEKGYRLLIASLQSPNPNFDAILASILLFVTSELIQSGKDYWRAHIDAATRILKQLDPESLSGSQSSSGFNSLRQWLASELVVYIVLASTFNPAATTPDLPESQAWLDSLLVRAEENNYLSCPATLLRVLLAASSLQSSENQLKELVCKEEDEEDEEKTSPSEDGKAVTTADAAALLQIVHDFDPPAWAVEIERRTLFGDCKSRMHVASAHKIAVGLYLCRTWPLDSSAADYAPAAALSTASSSSLASSCISHLSCIEPSDPLFKATPWPTFIAGAESDDDGERQWVLQRLNLAWETMAWGYIRSELDILQSIWANKEAWMSTAEAKAGLRYDWIQHLRRTGIDFLII